MAFLISLIVQGALSGAIYALIALAFVVVYKASRMANFALGEWVMLGALLVGAGLDALGLGLIGGVALAVTGMVLFAAAFNRLVLDRLQGRSVISVILITLGLGDIMRGTTAVIFRDLPHTIPSMLPTGGLILAGAHIGIDRLTAAALAIACVIAAATFYQRSRTGVALRAIADDQAAAMACGIDVNWYFTLAWGLCGAISVLAGVLWAMLSGGGIGLSIVGLKVFPVVVIGGLDSFSGAVVAALIVGLVESLAAGYGDPVLGAGFGSLATYLVLVACLWARPFGLFGRPEVERI
jgi:branched-chain amino acid transport system permease protein